jgi:hypothetical protein
MTQPEGSFAASSPAPAAPEVAHGRRMLATERRALVGFLIPAKEES